ncbi:MAG: hypothetical protein ACN4EP_07625 [Sediminibacterium sp.]
MCRILFIDGGCLIADGGFELEDGRWQISDLYGATFGKFELMRVQ